MKKVLFAICLLAISTGIASASTLLFDRGLPTENLNNAAGSNRSNVAWGFGAVSDGRWLAGDDFKLGSSGDFLIETIRIWTTSTDTSFWLGKAEGTFTQYSPSTSTAITYENSSSYQGSSGNFLNLYQVDFNLNAILSGATNYQFFLDGPVPSFIHSSNAELSGSNQEGADNLLLYAFASSGGILSDIGSWDSNGDGWDKSSDANIQIFGSAAPVPEPSTILLLGSGLMGLVWYGRKRKK